jgi:hypothetical protein
MPVQDYVPTDMDFIFEVKTNKFEKVILDCQSFITGMDFFEDGKVKYNVYLDMFQCEEMHNFLADSKRDNLPVCIGLDGEGSSLMISRDVENCL